MDTSETRGGAGRGPGALHKAQCQPRCTDLISTPACWISPSTAFALPDIQALGHSSLSGVAREYLSRPQQPAAREGQSRISFPLLRLTIGSSVRSHPGYIRPPDVAAPRRVLTSCRSGTNDLCRIISSRTGLVGSSRPDWSSIKRGCCREGVDRAAATRCARSGAATVPGYLLIQPSFQAQLDQQIG